MEVPKAHERATAQVSARHTESACSKTFSAKSEKADKNTGTVWCLNIIIKDAKGEGEEAVNYFCS